MDLFLVAFGLACLGFIYEHHCSRQQLREVCKQKGHLWDTDGEGGLRCLRCPLTHNKGTSWL